MVSVRFCCRSADGVSRETVQLPPSCLTQPVSAARAAAAQMLGLTPSQIELVFRGQPLLDDRLMASYELSTSSVLHAFRQPPDADAAPAVAPASEPADGTQLAWTLQHHTQDPARRHAFTQRLSRPEVLDRLLASVPGLEDDPIAVALLQEPGLLLQIASPRTHVKRLVARHPVLAAAASQLATLLGEGASGTGRAARAGSSAARAAARAMDERPMEAGSFDDDEGDDEPGAAGGAASGAAPPITRAQLASALAAAVPNLAAQSLGASREAAAGPVAVVRPQTVPATAAPAAALAAAPAPAVVPAPQQPLAGMISTEMVSAALREAMRALPGAQHGSPAAAVAQPPAPAPAAAPAAVLPVPDEAASQPQMADEAAVRQLLELGITNDETLVRQALQVSDGNINHAVEFIYASMQ